MHFQTVNYNFFFYIALYIICLAIQLLFHLFLLIHSVFLSNHVPNFLFFALFLETIYNFAIKCALLVHLSVAGAILSVLYAFRLKNCIPVHVELVPSYDTGTPFKGTAIAPEIIEPLQTTKVKDGKPVTLRCRIKGTPMPTVAWFRQSTQIPATEEFKIAIDGDVATLTIEEVYPEDSGKYTCVAKNQAGTSSTSAELLVEGRCLLILSPF